MKRYGDLYHKICSIDNLRLAHANARKGKTHYRDVIMVDEDPEKYILKIRKILLDKKYRVGKYDIIDRVVDSGKLRTIYRLDYYPHRIIHHAILQVIEPIWVKSFIADSYCCIKGRGIHRAMKKIKRILREEKPKYCLKLDIRKFYPSCDNEVMKKMIRRKLKDKDLLWLLDEIVDSAEGLPIGNYMSQYLANVYLNPFDWFCKQVLKIKNYFRYCDDIVIMSNSKEELREWFARIGEYLASIKLEMKSNWQVFPISARGIDFLGYRFFHGYTLLRKRIAKKALKVARVIKIKQSITAKQMRSLMSYNGWMIYANTLNLRKTIFNKEIKEMFLIKSQELGVSNPARGMIA